MSTCPLLERFKIDRPTCDFPEHCATHGCRWAHFHALDPVTGKPVTLPLPGIQGQADLFKT